MTKTSIWQWTAVETARAVREGQVSAVEVVQAHLARMSIANPPLNAVVVPLAADALSAAKAADAHQASGAELGPLHGVPITIKINVDVAGQANSNGVVAFKDNIAQEDAPVVANLRRAGAILLGLTNTPEFSLRAFTDNPLHGMTFNPWDAGITCGGSSGGAAAAVAAGIGAIAHGNDIGGSLRWPAHCNGTRLRHWTGIPSLGARPSPGSRTTWIATPQWLRSIARPASTWRRLATNSKRSRFLSFRLCGGSGGTSCSRSSP